MKIAKFASAKFHPTVFPTIRVRTLHYYRRFELGERSDEDEGKFKYTINFMPGSTLSVEALKRLYSGRIHEQQAGRPILGPPGGAVLRNGLLDTHRLPDGRVLCHANSVMDYEFCNGFILCLSVIDTTTASLFGDAAIWALELGNADVFAERMAHEIFKAVKIGHFGPFRMTQNDLDGLDASNVRWEHKLVEYGSRDLTISGAGEAQLRELGRKIANAPFYKPEKVLRQDGWYHYTEEKEYRFVFEFTNATRVYPVADTFVDIPHDAFADVIEPL